MVCSIKKWELVHDIVDGELEFVSMLITCHRIEDEELF